ncbi:MAG: MurR/RpiR family transcriptional regulator [Planctomycetes bacterium]|nr:MurR/RpiR family transcriptional regulator [Planctomycetota bacterium]
MSKRAPHDFHDRLTKAQPTLTRKMTRVAHYLSAHYRDAAFMTTRELAKAAGVSLATVVRFPMAIGYADFDALRDSVRSRVNFDLGGVERLKTLPAGRSAGAMLRRVIEADLESLRTLAASFSEEDLEEFTRLIQEARRVTILGFRYLSSAADYFAYSLSKIKAGVSAITRGDSTLSDRIQTMDGDDLVVVIAFARYPSDLVAAARRVHARGLRMIAITDSPMSPVAPLAETTLYVKTDMVEFVGSLSAPTALMNAIVSYLGIRLGKSAIRRLQALEESVTATGIYVPGKGSRPADALADLIGIAGKRARTR